MIAKTSTWSHAPARGRDEEYEAYWKLCHRCCRSGLVFAAGDRATAAAWRSRWSRRSWGRARRTRTRATAAGAHCGAERPIPIEDRRARFHREGSAKQEGERGFDRRCRHLRQGGQVAAGVPAVLRQSERDRDLPGGVGSASGAWEPVAEGSVA